MVCVALTVECCVLVVPERPCVFVAWFVGIIVCAARYTSAFLSLIPLMPSSPTPARSSAWTTIDVDDLSELKSELAARQARIRELESIVKGR